MLQSRAIQQSESITKHVCWCSSSLAARSLGRSWRFWCSGSLFLGFGLFARFSATVTLALLVGALSVAAANFLILELNDPYHGLMRLSDEPLRDAIAQIDR
jgi:hypothetical protein